MKNMYSYKYSTRDLRHKCPSLWSSQDDRRSSGSSLNSSAVMLRSCSSFLHRFSSRLKLQTITDDQKQRLVNKDEDIDVNQSLFSFLDLALN